LRFLGIARKAGAVETGEDMAGAAARAKKARVIFTASDASPNLIKRGDNFAFTGGVPHVRLPYTKAELGMALGKGVAGVIAITDVGIASKMVSELAQADPEKYGEAAESLQKTSERILKRRKEAHAHEKNVRAGKKKRSVK
jgi:ribosomal protein L7Ae-like RNA K-turn-binding protein